VYIAQIDMNADGAIRTGWAFVVVMGFANLLAVLFIQINFLIHM
jgi:hypothetical protein